MWRHTSTPSLPRPLEPVMNFAGSQKATPKAFDSSAQGCRACEATLGTERACAQPCKGCTPCAQGCAGGSARGPKDQPEEFLEIPRDNRLPIPKGLNRSGGVGLKTR